MNGFQWSGFTYWRPNTITASTIVTFVITMTLLTVADCLMPTTSTYDISATMRMAGRLRYAPVANQPACVHPATLAANSPLVQKDRKSTRLNSSHSQISYAVFCLKKKKKLFSQKIIYLSKWHPKRVLD